MLIRCLTLLTLIFSIKAYGSDMSPLALFHRCYSQISHQSAFAHSDFANVKQRILNGADPITECTNILKSVQFPNGQTQHPTSENEKLAILNTFHQLHHSWFGDNEMTSLANAATTMTKNQYDTSQPALYYMKALFGGAKAQYLWSSNESLRTKRSLGQLTQAYFQINGLPTNREDFAFAENTPFVERGKIIGYQNVGPLDLPYYRTNSDWTNKTPTGNIVVERNYSFGAFGTTPYLLMTIDEPQNFRSNGAQLMPRRWARRVFEDALCRALPVVRSSDVPQFVTQVLEAPEFRKAVSCNQCHASMDRMAATMRQFRYFVFNNNAHPGGVFAAQINNNSSPDPRDNIGWREVTDSNFARRAPEGVFYFRDYKGQLHDQNVANAQGFADILNQLDDPYICLAKRYYKYFTGIDVPIDDPGPTPRNLASTDKHYDNVVTLGKNLKNDPNQSLLTMIESLLRLDEYKKINVGDSNE